MSNGKETRPRGDIARAIRDALREGPKSRREIRQLLPHCASCAIKKSLDGMLTSGAITLDGEAYALSANIQTEDDYREYIRAIRRQSMSAQRGGRQGNVQNLHTFDAVRAAQVGNVLRAAW